MKITIDPGHGAKGNQYPPQPNYYEGTQMWKLSQYITSELQRYGAAVTNTRPSVTDDPEVYSRGVTAAKNGSKLMLSLHSNAAAAASVTGSETYYSVKGAQYKDLAAALAAKVSAIMGHNSRGAKTRTISGDTQTDYYGVIRGAANNGCTCAIILEHGFHTNAKDTAFLVRDENLRMLAAAEAQIIVNYFGLTASSASQSAAAAASTVKIMGRNTLSAEQMSAFLTSKNATPQIKCTPLELAKLYLSEGNTEGVRGDIAFAQAMQETGYFKYGNDVLPEQNNYCGLGATNTTPKGKGTWFDTPQIGVRAHIQHLKAYASKDALYHACVDPRFSLVTRGIAPDWADLNGRWAVPGVGYGEKILAIYDSMSAFKAPEVRTKYYRVQVGAFAGQANAVQLMNKVKAAGFDAYVKRPCGGDKLYRVQLGEFSSKANADALATKLKAAGFSALIKFE